MVRFELRDVAGGWEQARFGPTDQVDYALYESTTPRARDSDGRGSDGLGSDGLGSDTEPALRSYGSAHTFLRLYDLARLERTTHPAFLGARLRETGERVGPEGDELLELAVHGTSVRTTYSELRGALRSFFGVLFPALDRETPDESPDLGTFEVAVTDLDRLYAEVVD
ncbi:hypothetical protein BRD13_04865 [Halobacteriales archaeon SW_5_70_135]|nr:MAG: hypothetical protein BRD13_04865 [Halobacteriales archaeon SW_5_70_135]